MSAGSGEQGSRARPAGRLEDCRDDLALPPLPMTGLSPLDAVRSTSGPLHNLGGRLMASRSTFRRGAEWGWSDGLSFYVAGRGGVLGDVDAEVVAAAFGFFNPASIAPLWERGVAVAGARAAARRYNEAAAAWGRDRFDDDDDIGQLASLGERVIAAADGAALPLFAGWRAEPRVDDRAGHAGQVIHVLREWRGGNHLVATVAVGLRPLEAVLTSDGPQQATVCGWSEPFPDCQGLVPLRQEAEGLTDRLCSAAFERGLDSGERAAFAALVGAAHARVTGG